VLRPIIDFVPHPPDRWLDRIVAHGGGGELGVQAAAGPRRGCRRTNRKL